MEYRRLGESGTVVSRLALGSMYFGGETSETDAFGIMDAYVEAGGNLIDTANVYMGGQSEAIVGKWFAARPSEMTDRVVLTTKGRHSTHAGPNAAGLSRRGLQRLLDESLANLGRERIDLYQLHSWDPLTPPEETLRFLDAAVRAGKIHYVGLSNFTGWQLQLFVSTAREFGLEIPITLQQQYSLLSRENEWEVIPAALHNRIGLLPWSPLAGGFLAGKYQRGARPASGTRAGSEKPLYQWDVGGIRRQRPQLGDHRPCQADRRAHRQDPLAGRPRVGRRSTHRHRAHLRRPHDGAPARQPRRRHAAPRRRG